MAEAALATAIDTLMTAAADTAVAMTTAPVAQDMTIAATEVAAVAMTTVLVVSIAMLLTAATVAGMVAGMADARAVVRADVTTVGVVEVATTTGLHPQLLAHTMHLLRVRRTAEDARTRVTTIAHTASSQLTQAEPKRY